jgi:hypothetical protein
VPGVAQVDSALLFVLYVPLLVAFVGWAVVSLVVTDPLVPQDEHDVAPAAPTS